MAEGISPNSNTEYSSILKTLVAVFDNRSRWQHPTELSFQIGECFVCVGAPFANIGFRLTRVHLAPHHDPRLSSLPIGCLDLSQQFSSVRKFPTYIAALYTMGCVPSSPADSEAKARA